MADNQNAMDRISESSPPSRTTEVDRTTVQSLQTGASPSGPRGEVFNDGGVDFAHQPNIGQQNLFGDTAHESSGGIFQVSDTLASHGGIFKADSSADGGLAGGKEGAKEWDKFTVTGLSGTDAAPGGVDAAGLFQQAEQQSKDAAGQFSQQFEQIMQAAQKEMQQEEQNIQSLLNGWFHNTGERPGCSHPPNDPVATPGDGNQPKTPSGNNGPKEISDLNNILKDAKGGDASTALSDLEQLFKDAPNDPHAKDRSSDPNATQSEKELQDLANIDADARRGDTSAALSDLQQLFSDSQGSGAGTPSGGTPGDGSNNPSGTGTTPGDGSSNPSDTGTTPGDGTSNPSGTGTTPGDGSSNPSGTGTNPGDGSSNPSGSKLDMSSIFTRGPGVTDAQYQHAVVVANALPDDMKSELLNRGVTMEIDAGFQGGPQGQNDGSHGQFYADSGMADQALLHELYEMYRGPGSWNDPKAVQLADQALSGPMPGGDPGDLNDTVSNVPGDLDPGSHVHGNGDAMSNAFVADVFATHPGLDQDTVGDFVLSRTTQDAPQLEAYIAQQQGLKNAAG